MRVFINQPLIMDDPPVPVGAVSRHTMKLTDRDTV
jgi:hypothetical protein